MHRRDLAAPIALATVIAISTLAPVLVAGQTATARTDAATPDATPWGDPDLQGVWASDSATPLERPDELAGKAVLTDEETAALATRAAQLFNGDTDAAFGESVFRAALSEAQEYQSRDGATTEAPRGTGNYNQFLLIDRWFDNRTSLIVDPPDGRIPPLTPEAQARRQARAEARRPSLPDGPQDLGSMRCLGGRVPMTGRGYNSNYQIVQAPGYVAILMEMMHEVRIIPLDGRQHVASHIRQRLGDSRGRWEGDTLIVDTVNFADGAVRSRGGTRENLRLVERFTRVDTDTLQYEYTMHDPTTWTRPWTARILMRPTPGTGVIYEFACHEGNYAIPNTLSGARAQEKAMAEAASTR